MDLGSRTRMVNFEPIDATPAPAEQFDDLARTLGEPDEAPVLARAAARRALAVEIGPPAEPVERQVEFAGTDWV